jgi:hypothetical protein
MPTFTSNHGELAFLAKLSDVPHVAGAVAGASVRTHVTFRKSPLGQACLPAKYSVGVLPDQPAVASVVDKSDTGFMVVLSPFNGLALSAGTFDVVILG